ncbi:aggregation-promoting factor C-terminal-like domain-containing protein [Rhodococcus pyridinivorans]|uniref:Tape measure protein n=1 Tax=Rhodococcus pyridinivorans TaxID=103816 RepID=A0A7M2XQ25_9NOCA|nr:tape measure protein [Rhodococcus pyridinivorans]QOV99503.1 tape measure protein [Rhodococcus pyridinivorans]
MADDVVWVPVLPSLRGFARQLDSEGRKAGESAGRSTAEAMADAIAKGQKAVQAASAAVEKARAREADAAGRVRTAEAALKELRDRGVTDAGRLTAATERVAKARRDEELRTRETATASQRLQGAQRDLKQRTQDAAKASDEQARSVKVAASGMDDAEKSASGLSGKLGGLAKMAAGAATALVGINTVKSALTAGWDRLTAIDNARGKLTGLGHDAASTQEIMDSAMESVKGTAYGFGDAASLAASAVAAGVKPGQQLTKYLSRIGDAAAIAGVDLGEMGQILNQVQTAGLAQAEELNRLAERGIPIYQWLASEMGVTAQEVKKLASEGKVSSEAYFAAIDKNIGGASKSMDTTQMAMSNARAAWSRFGAVLAEPFFEQAKSGAAALTGVLDGMTSKLGPAMDKLSAYMNLTKGILLEGDYKPEFGNSLGLEEDSPIVTQLLTFRERVQEFAAEYGPRLSAVFDQIRDAAIAAAPHVGEIVESFSTAVGSAGLTTWELLVQTLEALAPVLEEVVIPALGSLADLMADNQSAVNTLVGGYLGFEVVSNVWDTAIGGLETMQGAVEEVTGVIDSGKELYGVYTDATYGIAQAQSTLSGRMAAAAGAIRGKAAAENISTAAAVRGIIAEKAHNAALKVKAVALKAVAVAQRLWNAALSANPIGLIIVAIAAVATALGYFFTQTETGRRLWDTIWKAMGDAVSWVWESVIKPAWEGIKTGIRAVGDAAIWAWEHLIKPAWDGIKTGFEAAGAAVQWVYNNVLKPIFTVLKVIFAVITAAVVFFGLMWQKVFNLVATVVTHWWNTVLMPVFNAVKTALQAVGEFFMWVWTALIQPAWNAMGTGIRWVYDNVLLPTWNALKTALQAVGDFFVWVWNSIIKPAWDGLGTGVRWVYDNILVPTWNALKAALQAVGDFFVWVWNSIIKPAWDGLGAGVRWVYDNVLLPAWNGMKTALQAVGDFFVWIWNSIIKPAWDGLGAGIRWVVDNVITPVWEGLKTGLNAVGTAFESVVGWIGEMWDKLRGIVAKPVKFVIDSVYNNGIVKAWNMVAGWLGLDLLDEYKPEWLGQYAGGGVLPGYSPGRDNLRFVSTDGSAAIDLSGGESILRPEVAKAVGPEWVDGVNTAAKQGGPGAVRQYLGGFQGGGIVESIIAIAQQHFPGLSVSSSYRSTNDLHGQGKAVDLSNQYSGGPSTPLMQDAARFFYSNYGPQLAELIHWPLNGWQNIDEGQPFNFGEPTNSQHTDHVHVASHVPLGDPGEVDGNWFTRAVRAAVGWLRRQVADTFDAVMNPIGNNIPSFGDSPIGQLPRKAFDTFRDKTRDWLLGQADKKEGSSGANLTPGTGPVADQVREAMAAYGWDTGPQWDAVDWIIGRESGWDPMARNPSSGAFGLAQFLGSTKDQYLPDENPNPRIQGDAMARYIRDRYGDPLAAKAFWEQNGWYDQGGLARGRGLMLKNVIDPERVLDPVTTRAFEALVPFIADAATNLGNVGGWSELPGAAEYGAFLTQLPGQIAEEQGRDALDFFGLGALGDLIFAEPTTATTTPSTPADAGLGAVDSTTTDSDSDAANTTSGPQGPLVWIENLITNDPEEAAETMSREARRLVRSDALSGGWG